MILVLMLTVWAPFFAKSGTVVKKLYIVSGTIKTADSSYINTTAFCEQNSFVHKQTSITVFEGDSIAFNIVNHDSISHHFTIKGKAMVSMLPGDSADINLSFGNSGAWIFYDDMNYPNNYYKGLCGSIIVVKPTEKIFVWNLREQEKALTLNLDSGKQIDFNTYEPDYFFINNLNFPEVEQDSTAQITGKTNQLFLLAIANTGLSAHSIHFHGYHGKVIFSNSKNNRVDWEKDTYPLEPLESIIIQFLPDKPGKFPVHDHNLFAVSGGGKYPNGMMVMMEIK